MTATKFTFRMADGKYPVTARGKLQWMSDRAKAIEMGQSVGAAELVEMDDKGKVLATSPLPNAQRGGRAVARTLDAVLGGAS
jgi:hypothetical protein